MAQNSSFKICHYNSIHRKQFTQESIIIIFFCILYRKIRTCDVQYFVVWSVVSTPLKCLPTDSLEHKSFHGDDDRMLGFVHPHFNEASSFPNNLITASRLSYEPHKRVKRVLVFRPLFVYRQEQIKRKRIIEKRKERSQKTKHSRNGPTERPTPKHPCTCCNECRRY